MSAISVHPSDLAIERTELSESRSGELSGYTVDFGLAKAGLVMGPGMFAGLPDDACPCPHWGILLRGEWRIPFTDGRIETVRAGEAYHLPPGHRFEVVEDCEYIEFSPTEQLRETYAVVAKNMNP